MEVNSNEFCYLSTSESFLGWLYRNCSEMHSELVEHLKKSLGCSANRKKMLAILGEIKKDTKLSESLAEFIRSHYPHIITEDDPGKSQPSAQNKMNRHSVFSHYDPTLNSFPRRLIIIERHESELRRDVLDFCARQGYCDHVIVEDRAYIEYLPPEHAVLREKIPAKNWQVSIYKRANGLK